MAQEGVSSIPNVARLVVTFEAADEEKLARSDAPQAFWDYLRRHVRNGGIDNENIRELEQRVVQKFGRYLRDLLATDFRTGGENEYRRRRFPGEFYVERNAAPVPAFAFQVTGFRYGTLSLDIDVAGLKGLADFFDKNSDLLRIVLCQYAPNALAMAASGNGGGSIDGLECRFQSAPELERAFTSQPSPPPGTSATQTADAASPKKLEALNWAWIVSNTSLLVPVVLSLVIVYFAFVSIEHERDRLSQAMSSLADKQTEMMKVLAAIAQPQKSAADVVTKSPSPTKP